MFGKKKALNRDKQAILDENYKEAYHEPTGKEKNEANQKQRKHFQQVTKFEQDRLAFHKTMAKVGLGFGAMGIIVGLAAVGAVFYLTPLKTVEPFVIRVDNSTGFTDIVQPLSNAKEKTYGEELDKYWLARFIEERESYNWEFALNSLKTVELMSSRNVFAEYDTYIRSQVSPLYLFKDRRKIKVQIHSIAFVTDVAHIRFSKQVLDSKGNPDNSIPTTYWLATAAYDYKHKIEFEKQRRINPLGFQVTSYRIDPENVTGTPKTNTK
ncbi:virB8 family protein [Rodentibacter caecimuris]|uniref:virB8 family protein n=1 Tax=Rodentibacter caecimuris TaxID=1796644 RepID=UPI002119EBDF|nr:type IV secretion system protein [Rodentibacter heylii]MCQ9124686.1 type IV secretion system protein [Rodentibacter heylii]